MPGTMTWWCRPDTCPMTASPYCQGHQGDDPPAWWNSRPDHSPIAVAGDEHAAEQGVRALLRLLGRDPARDASVRATPARFVKAMLEMGTSNAEPASLLGVTFGGIDYPADQMIAVGPVPFVSLCEHHLLPFPGTAWVAYIPSEAGGVVGLSKLPRLVDHYAARPQVQERLTTQIADALVGYLDPAGAACVIKATHGCMSHRGVRKPGASMVTSVLHGAFRDNPQTRAEFLALTREGT